MSSEHMPGHTTPGAANGLDTVDLERRPEAVLSVLEADQLVAAKERARFGRARLSSGARLLLAGLRLYVIAMMIVVAVQVFNAVHGGH